MNEKDIIYHYTSLDKFKCILQYGTLRFKESTTSNDLLDTTLLFDVLKEYDGLPDYRDLWKWRESLCLITIKNSKRVINTFLWFLVLQKKVIQECFGTPIQ